MNEATTPQDSPWDEELLRAVAILQLKCLMLDGQSDILSDLSDMQAHRRLNSTLSGYIAAHARSGALPLDPIGEIKVRLEKVSQVFSSIAQYQKDLTKRYLYLSNNPFKSSLADLTQSQKQLEDDMYQFPERLGALVAGLSPLDWKCSPSPADLHPELLLCAQGLGINLPNKKSRTGYCALAQAEGLTYAGFQQVFQTACERIQSLLASHTRHSESLAQVAEFNIGGNFLTARQLLQQTGIGGTHPCSFNDLDYSPINEADLQSDLSNKAREHAVALPGKCQACVQRFSQVAGTGKQAAQLSIERAYLANLRASYNKFWEATVVAHPGSELEQECKPTLESVKDWFEWAYAELAAKEAAGSKKRSQMIATATIATVVSALFLALGIGLWSNHNAKVAAEKQARLELEAKREAEEAERQAEAAADAKRRAEAVAALAKIESDAEATRLAEATAADAKRRAEAAEAEAKRQADADAAAAKRQADANAAEAERQAEANAAEVKRQAKAEAEARRREQEAKAQVSRASKISPFLNSLGMKFVPVGGTAVLFSVWDTRVRDYEVFATANSMGFNEDWKSPGFTQTPNDPVVNVNWNNAKAFCRWLTEKERAEGVIGKDQEYRLPTDAEWSVAVGLGSERATTPKKKDQLDRSAYPWGRQWLPPRGVGNYCQSLGIDSYEYTSPVGSFPANLMGLYDMGGNVWQWCEDEFSPGQGGRVVRGGSWDSNDPVNLLSSYRGTDSPLRVDKLYGFRCVLVRGSPR